MRRIKSNINLTLDFCIYLYVTPTIVVLVDQGYSMKEEGEKPLSLFLWSLENGANDGIYSFSAVPQFVSSHKVVKLSTSCLYKRVSSTPYSSNLAV